MPSNYSGNPANITTPLSRGIVSCASGAGGLVLVGTSTSHLFATYDSVSISGVLGTTEANTEAEITVIDSTHFLLQGVPFVNAYSSGGTAEDISLTPYFQIPDDGEAGTVESIEAGLQMVADRTQYLMGVTRTFGRTEEFLADATWTCPPGVHSVHLGGCGAGAGGGTGWSQVALANQTRSPGGGGGGAARYSECVVPVVPGTTYAITIGAGGAGGAGGPPGTVNDGAQGADTTFGTLARFKGAGGGTYGSVADTTVGAKQSNGGMPINDMTNFISRTLPNYGSAWTLSVAADMSPLLPSQGGGSIAYGSSTTSSYGANGAPSPIAIGGNWQGGQGGASATDSGTRYAGSGGGGGGGGPFGSGGAGGDGGNGNNAGTGSSGNSGSDAPANSGAGGGGSGAPGFGSVANGASAGLAGAGGSGRLYLTRNG